MLLSSSSLRSSVYIYPILHNHRQYPHTISVIRSVKYFQNKNKHKNDGGLAWWCVCSFLYHPYAVENIFAVIFLPPKGVSKIVSWAHLNASKVIFKRCEIGLLQKAIIIGTGDENLILYIHIGFENIMPVVSI